MAYNFLFILYKNLAQFNMGKKYLESNIFFNF